MSLFTEDEWVNEKDGAPMNLELQVYIPFKSRSFPFLLEKLLCAGGSEIT